MPLDNDSEVEFLWNGVSRGDLSDILWDFDDLLSEPLSERVEIPEYAEKLINRAQVATISVGGRVRGLVAVYVNDMRERRAYIPLVLVDRPSHGLGYGRALVERAIAKARAAGMRSIWTHVLPHNAPAFGLYRSLGFVHAGRRVDRHTLRKSLIGPSEVQLGSETPIETWQQLSDLFSLDVDLIVKRDDLYPIFGGGNKARKACYSLKNLMQLECDVVVTNGTASSNHIRAVAVLAAQFGIRCHILIVEDRLTVGSEELNLKIAAASGAVISPTESALLAADMDSVCRSYRLRGHNPYYLWGGGHDWTGVKAYAEASVEVQRQLGSWSPDYVIAPVGTGSTLAGLALGTQKSSTRLAGVSVARDVARAVSGVEHGLDEYFARFGERPVAPWSVYDEWSCGGYGHQDEHLMAVVSGARSIGFPVDLVYSGKVLAGLIGLVRSRRILPGSKVLYWHSGSMTNLMTNLNCKVTHGEWE